MRRHIFNEPVFPAIGQARDNPSLGAEERPDALASQRPSPRAAQRLAGPVFSERSYCPID